MMTAVYFQMIQGTKKVCVHVCVCVCVCVFRGGEWKGGGRWENWKKNISDSAILKATTAEGNSEQG